MIAARPEVRRGVPGLLRYIFALEFVRYGLVSLAALIADLAVFRIGLLMSLPSAMVAAFGYSAGIVVAWVLLSRYVFASRAAQGGRARVQQKTLFLAMAWVGLALTVVIVTLAVALGAGVVLAKATAVLFSFTSNYLVRKYMVFRVPRGGDGHA